jgi:hypothetical protein
MSHHNTRWHMVSSWHKGCSGPGNKYLLSQMSILPLPLKMAHWSLLFELLERAHSVNVETTCKLHETTCLNSVKLVLTISHDAKNVCTPTWCTLKANRTPWSINSSSSGPTLMDSSSEETRSRYFLANFTDWNFICTWNRSLANSNHHIIKLTCASIQWPKQATYHVYKVLK